jgi:hypothetical protein
MRSSMLRTREWLISALLGLGLMSGIWHSDAAVAAERYTNAVLKGDYAVVSVGQGGISPQAGVSVATYDGRGSFSGITIQDVPGASFGERLFVRSPFGGTYTINADGTGTGTVTTALADGSHEEVNTALVVTRMATVAGAQVAEEFFFMREKLISRTGALLRSVATRLPDGGKFTNASLSGNYVYTLTGQGGPVPQLGLGTMNYDGVGSFSGTATVNLPGGVFGERRFVTAPFVRPYEVSPDGTGVATPPGESDIVFVITKADVVGDIKVGKEVFFIVRELNSVTGNLLTGVITRLSD